MAAELVSTGFRHTTLPGNYVRPLSARPCLSAVSTPEDLPLIDLSSTVQIPLIEQISQVCIPLGISQDSFGNGDANSLRSNPETGIIDLSSLAQSERAVQILQELLIKQTMQATADQIINFLELWTTVPNASKWSPEGKRKYELETSKKIELLHKERLNGVCADESSRKGMDHLANSQRLHVQENGKSGRSSFLERICSHEVLQDGQSNSPNGSNNKLKRKGQANDQHKEEIVSFESGDITTAPLNGVCADESNSKEMDHIANSPRLHVQENVKSGGSMERIRSHEVLQDGGESTNTPNGSKSKLKRKVKKYLRCVVGGCVKVGLLVVCHEFWTSDCFGF